MFIVKKVYQSLLCIGQVVPPLEHPKVVTTLSRHFFFLEMFKLFDTLSQRKRSVANFLLQW